MIPFALFYTEQDAKRNASFIEALLEAGKRVQLDGTLVTDEQKLHPYDYIFNRTRIHHEALKTLDATFFNPLRVNVLANDKEKTIQFAQMLGIPTIPTTRFTQPLPPFPIVLKTRDGHGGEEVYLCYDERDVAIVTERHDPHTLLVQPYVESDATDVRIWMVGKHILGAVKRQGKENFKSNYTLGGTVTPFELPSVLVEYATRIQRALHSDYIGIDFLIGRDGHFYLNEIEDPVGARSLYETTEIDVASCIMQHIAKRIHH
ncbi:ATP-grasp domain-containing protein [Savagea faecisuis]|uniref:RimK family alpha-L-glutamate ligase n=1 Tax=Savagea faecisuis TaxID=1274803 RepID=A0ABW3GXG3_9BACL